MASALRAAILGHIRVPVAQTLTLNGSKLSLFGAVRSMSSHGDDHLTREEVIDRVLDVVKSFPKVDASKWIMVPCLLSPFVSGAQLQLLVQCVASWFLS